VIVRRNRFRFQHRRGHQNLENRTWRELCLNGAVRSGRSGSSLSDLPFVFGNAHRKVIGIVGRLVAMAETSPVLGLRPPPRLFPDQGFFGDELQVIVDRQTMGLPGTTSVTARAGPLAAHALTMEPSCRPRHQLLVVLPLQAGLADDIAGTIAGILLRSDPR